jgi:hypothetical protein
VPLPWGSCKVNFDVAIQPTFVIAAAVLRDHSGNYLAINTLKLPLMDANLGEAHAALLAARLAHSFCCSSLIIEGDSLLTILIITDPHLFENWNSAPVISDIRLQLSPCVDWKTLKFYRCANVCAHLIARWAASNLVFGCIFTFSYSLSLIRFLSGKDPPL